MHLLLKKKIKIIKNLQCRKTFSRKIYHSRFIEAEYSVSSTASLEKKKKFKMLFASKNIRISLNISTHAFYAYFKNSSWSPITANIIIIFYFFTQNKDTHKTYVLLNRLEMFCLILSSQNDM